MKNETMVRNNRLGKYMFHFNRREKGKKERGCVGGSALCHVVIIIQFSSGAASLHSLLGCFFVHLLHTSLQWIQVHSIPVCYSWHANRSFLICTARVCVTNASVHNVHTPVYTQCISHLTAGACMQPMCGVCVLNITEANPSEEITSLTLSPCGMRPSSVSKETDCSRNPTINYTEQEQSHMLTFMCTCFCSSSEASITDHAMTCGNVHITEESIHFYNVFFFF